MASAFGTRESAPLYKKKKRKNLATALFMLYLFIISSSYYNSNL